MLISEVAMTFFPKRLLCQTSDSVRIDLFFARKTSRRDACEGLPPLNPAFSCSSRERREEQGPGAGFYCIEPSPKARKILPMSCQKIFASFRTYGLSFCSGDGQAGF